LVTAGPPNFGGGGIPHLRHNQLVGVRRVAHYWAGMVRKDARRRQVANGRKRDGRNYAPNARANALRSPHVRLTVPKQRRSCSKWKLRGAARDDR
jgi:hypothetical protein